MSPATSRAERERGKRADRAVERISEGAWLQLTFSHKALLRVALLLDSAPNDLVWMLANEADRVETLDPPPWTIPAAQPQAEKET